MPDECFEDPEFVQEKPASWAEPFVGKRGVYLGDMIHAFPKCKFETVSFARDLNEPQYVIFISDGDLNMCTGMREGMGEGRMALNRSGIDTLIFGCGFHKGKSIKEMTSRFITAARAGRRKRECAYLKPLSPLLDGNRDYQNLFGTLVDEVLQHDDRLVGLMLWKMLLRKARLMGMEEYAKHIDTYHHPVNGRQGTWGRWNHNQEGSLDAQQRHVGPVPYLGTIAYGSSSTSNAIEGRMNKLMKLATGTSLCYGALSTKSQRMLTTLGRDMTSIVFSLVGDQQGECLVTEHRKRSGAPSVQKTGKPI